MCKERAIGEQKMLQRGMLELWTKNDLCTLNDPSVIGGPQSVIVKKKARPKKSRPLLTYEKHQVQI